MQLDTSTVLRKPNRSMTATGNATPNARLITPSAFRGICGWQSGRRSGRRNRKRRWPRRRKRWRMRRAKCRGHGCGERRTHRHIEQTPLANRIAKGVFHRLRGNAIHLVVNITHSHPRSRASGCVLRIILTRPASRVCASVSSPWKSSARYFCNSSRSCLRVADDR